MTEKKNDKKKTKKVKEIKYRSEEQQEIIRFIVILTSIFILVGIVYGVSKIFIKDNKSDQGETVTPGVVNYDLVTVGTMFNRPEEEYYVAIYDRNRKDAVVFSAIINKYTNEEKANHVYFCDLDSFFNKDYIAKDGKSNPKAKVMSELSLGEFTFVKIKNGKIVTYLETKEDMKKELGV